MLRWGRCLNRLSAVWSIVTAGAQGQDRHQQSTGSQSPFGCVVDCDPRAGELAAPRFPVSIAFRLCGRL